MTSASKVYINIGNPAFGSIALMTVEIRANNKMQLSCPFDTNCLRFELIKHVLCRQNYILQASQNAKEYIPVPRSAIDLTISTAVSYLSRLPFCKITRNPFILLLLSISGAFVDLKSQPSRPAPLNHSGLYQLYPVQEDISE